MNDLSVTTDPMAQPMTQPMTQPAEPRLTSLSHGGGCGCKIAPAVLSDLLARARGASVLPLPEQLLVGIETSDDAAVWKLDDTHAIVATTDFFMPIVDDPYDFGRIAATNALSDIYAMGAKPLFALALVGMPVAVLSPATIARILEGGQAVCAAAGIPIAGGHTIDSVEPIYGLVAIGVVAPDRVLSNRTARSGDAIVLGKPLGVGIYSARLKKSGLDDDDYARMIRSTTQLNAVGAALAEVAGVHALTDVTGFGLLGHLLEMCRGASLDATVDLDRVPLLPRARRFATEGSVTGASHRNLASYGGDVTVAAGHDDVERLLLSDPQTSGGLLVAVAPDAVEAVLERFRDAGFDEAAAIGRFSTASSDRPRVTVA
jgi:selenide,water dikinase